VTGEEERLERVLPPIRRYGAAVVAISNDDTGISEDPDVRFEVARRIVERAADHGVPREDVIVDPLVMPIGAMATAGQQVFRLVRRLREELGVNTTCGASNVSFGMPDRERINAAFLPMAIASGLTSAITNPLAAEVKAAIMAADVLMGNDQDAGRWIRAHRLAAAPVPAPGRVAPAAATVRTPDLVALPGGAAEPAGPATEPGRAAGSRPRINRRALAAAAAMRDAGARGSGRGA
jgi:5-methyltetrahydrofolate--homocysteine methyltransferase